MKIKTAEATPLQLNWLVATCEGLEFDDEGKPIWFPDSDEYFAVPREVYSPSTNWAQGGPIIEREWICADRLMDGRWWACKRTNAGDSMLFQNAGPTPLIAAMRCYVTSKMGDEVEIPEELAP